MFIILEFLNREEAETLEVIQKTSPKELKKVLIYQWALANGTTVWSDEILRTKEVKKNPKQSTFYLYKTQW